MGLIGGFRLGSLFGIEIAIDWSLTVIFLLLITFSLAVGVLPAWHPDWSAALNWMTAIAAAIVFFASVLAYDLSHALVGRRSFGGSYLWTLPEETPEHLRQGQRCHPVVACAPIADRRGTRGCRPPSRLAHPWPAGSRH
ncbi:MAG: hypothetical protein H0T88_00440 [Lysobacter sp.]|nr:hypothetical protein [Lysobacter sp.]